MNVLKYRVSLDMFDILSQTTIKAKKGDSACQIHITLTEHGKIYQIGEGCYATFIAKKSDGNFIYDNCTIKNNTIVYDFGTSVDENGICQVSAYEGSVECEVTLYKANSEQLTSPRFTLFIDGTVYNGEEIISTTKSNVLKELINKAKDTVDEIETKFENGEFVGEKGETGNSGVYIGSSEPQGDANVWVDTGEDEVIEIKDAYAYAQDGGYKGTESEFAQDMNPDNINANSKEFILTELAKRGQLKPEFANSIDECTDTTKLYVLPDGYIYAYMTKTGALFTNQIANAIDTDGTPYNGGLGYKTGHRFHAFVQDAPPLFNDLIEEKSNSLVTGLIPYNQETVIRACGWTAELTNDDYIYFFDENFKVLAEQRSRLSYYISEYGIPFGDEPAVGGKAKTFTLNRKYFAEETPWYNGELNKARYVAFSIQSPSTEHIIVTFNQEIAYGTETKWMNTGRAFVPADYEDRIIAVEKTTESHETRIKKLEMYGAESVSGEEIPPYIKAEAEDVIDRLIDVKEESGRCFTIIGLSDFHYYNYDSVHNSPDNDNRRTLINAAKAISYIGNRMHIDAIATLGDVVPFGVTDKGAIQYTKKYFKEINEILTMTQQPGVIDFRAVGNHDRAGGNDTNGNPTPYIPDNTIYSYIGGYNRQCNYVNVPAGYGYKDFEGYKLRVIVLNTSECEGKSRFSIESGYHMSNKQYQWLINTLDLSSKEDANKWQILLLSHHRADDGQIGTDATSPYYNNGYLLPNILNAYVTGGSFTGYVDEENISVSCNFSGKNQAWLIGQIHGHHHDYKFQKLYLGSDGDRGNSSQTEIMAVGTPTTSFVENGNEDNDGNTYSSIKDTAEETAFCVYSIDLDNHKIHAIHYGNGVDREIDY